MHRTFITFITIAALAISGLSAAPAYAGDKKAARWIAGIAAAAIIGAAIQDANKRDKRRRQQQQQVPRYDPDYGQRRGHKNDRGYDDDYARPVPRSVQRKLLPDRCLVRGETRRGPVRGFGRGCLNRYYNFTNSLPQQCAVRALNRRGEYRRVIYRKACLNKFGYQVARR